MADTEPEDIVRRLGEKWTQAEQNGLVTLDDDDEARMLIEKAISVVNLDTHGLLAIATRENYRTFSIEFDKQLIREYGCTTASEKALVQLIVSAHVRSLQYAAELSNNTGAGKPITSTRNGLYSVLSKEIDRANRQFITGLTALKQLKAPGLTVNVKTNTAFIAQNQQVNSGEVVENGQNNDAK